MNERLPIFPLHTVLFPGELLPLHVFESRYRLMVSRCVDRDPCFGVVLTRGGSEVGDQPDSYTLGTAAMCIEHILLPDGRSNLLVKGGRRFQILESDWDESYMTATVEWLDSPGPAEASAAAVEATGRIRVLLDRYLHAYHQLTGRQVEFSKLEEEPVAFAYRVAAAFPLPKLTRQRLLEAAPPDQLLALLEETVRHETELIAKTGAFAFLPGQPGARFTAN